MGIFKKNRFVKTNIPFDVKTESGSKVQQSLFDIFSKQISEIISVIKDLCIISCTQLLFSFFFII